MSFQKQLKNVIPDTTSIIYVLHNLASKTLTLKCSHKNLQPTLNRVMVGNTLTIIELNDVG